MSRNFVSKVMENKVFSNPKEDKYFVPVTYYGLPNPKLK